MWAASGAGTFLPYVQIFENFAVGFMCALNINFLQQCPICCDFPFFLNCDGTTCDRGKAPDSPGVAMCLQDPILNSREDKPNTLKHVTTRTMAFRPIRRGSQEQLCTPPTQSVLVPETECSYASFGLCVDLQGVNGGELQRCSKCDTTMHTECQHAAEHCKLARTDEADCTYCYSCLYAHVAKICVQNVEPLLPAEDMTQGNLVVEPLLPHIKHIGKLLSALTKTADSQAASARRNATVEDFLPLLEFLDGMDDSDSDFGLGSHCVGILRVACHMCLHLCHPDFDLHALSIPQKRVYAALGAVLDTLSQEHTAFTSVRFRSLHLWGAICESLDSTECTEPDWHELEQLCVFPALTELPKLLWAYTKPGTEPAGATAESHGVEWLRGPVHNFYLGLRVTAQMYAEEIRHLQSSSSDDAAAPWEAQDVQDDLPEEGQEPTHGGGVLGGGAGGGGSEGSSDSMDEESDDNVWIPLRASPRVRVRGAPPAPALAPTLKRKVRKTGRKAAAARLRLATKDRPTSDEPLQPLNPTVHAALYHFNAKGIPKKLGVSYIEDTKPAAKSLCRKFYQTATMGTWGIFLFFCAHSHIYGFHDIMHAEGRRDAFFVLRNLANKPKVVIYDFGCQLEEYCMARDPFYFQDVVFVIDKFHHFNHTCCAMYKLAFYTHLKWLNSVMCEQGNNHIKGAMQHQGKKLRDKLFYLLLLVQIARWNYNKDELSTAEVAAQSRRNDARGE